MKRPVERKASEEDRWDLTRTATTERPRQLLTLEQMGGERVVGDDLEIPALPDERACCSPSL